MKVVIHIGGNKTASTLLQRHLFSQHKSLRYIGEDCDRYSDLKPLLDSLVADDDSYFDMLKTKQIFEERFTPSAEFRACVYSNEDIMTSQFPSVCASRLSRLLPNADVVMVLRNQLTTWPSWYANHGAYLKNVPRRYWRRHVSFAEWLEYCFMFPKTTPVEAMNYNRYFDIFRDAFPTSKIHVLLYEELLSNPDEYFEKWADILTIPKGEILSAMQGRVERSRNSGRRLWFDRGASTLAAIPGGARVLGLLHQVMPALDKWLDQGVPARVELPEGWEAPIAEYYRMGNRALVQKTGLDLARYGYPV